MNTTRALEIAHARVSLVARADQYVLHVWSPSHNATWVSEVGDIHRARCAAYETKIRIALELMGVEDAGARANGAVERSMGGYRPDWRKVVRAELRR